MLYKGRFSCSPLFHYNSGSCGTIEWTWKTTPPEAIYWKTYKCKKKDVRVLSKVTKEQRKLLTDALYEHYIESEHPKKIKQPKVRRL
tara:strand:+ start:217 stop:477 length:261 start_codon:yes stop_codon:yes gene_type:complete